MLIHVLQRKNRFSHLRAFKKSKPDPSTSELDRYLAADPEHTENPVQWCHKHREEYPRLSRMAISYLTIAFHAVNRSMSELRSWGAMFFLMSD